MSAHVRSDSLAGLRGADRLRALDHVQSCPDCLRRMTEEDPTALFRLIALRSLPSPVLDAVSAGVARGIDREPIWIPRWGRASAGRVAAWAAGLVLAALAMEVRWTGPTPGQRSLAASSVAEASGGGVELLSASAAAQLVDLTVGDAEVVMIFDRRMDL